MGNVLLLGGAGFIGYHLSRHLAEQGRDHVTIVDNLSRGALDADLEALLARHRQIALQTGDLTDARTLSRLHRRFDHVYLLAGVLGARTVHARPADVIRTNTAILLNTLEWLAGVGCGRLLFASTSEVYAGSIELGIGTVPTSETVPLAVQDIQRPRSTYAATKLLGEAAVTHYAQASGFEAVIVRYHNVYGPRMGLAHVIPELMERIVRRMDPLPVYGLEQTRAFCYVTDAVEASVALMRCRLDGTPIVHVGNDREEITVAALLDKLLTLADFHPEIQRLPALSGAVSRRCPAIDRLRTLTGCQPRVGLDEGLALTWDWYRRALSQGREAAELAAARQDNP